MIIRSTEKCCVARKYYEIAAEQGDFSVQYYDPESGRIRKYYPDFFARMTDGTYQLIEVKGGQYGG